MKPVIRFECRYDVNRLVADLHAAEQEVAFRPNIAGYHDGGWKAIPLVSKDGSLEAEPFVSHTVQKATYAKTPVLAKCPYFNEIIDGFLCPTNQVRLLRLEPGAKIHRHHDPEEAWAFGYGVRLHIPIITHDDVQFYVKGQRIYMRPGELWYCDFGHYHSVHNSSPIARVHMVLDLELNDWLRAMFPRERWPDHVANWVYRRRHRLEKTMLRWGRAAGLGRVRRALAR